MRRVAPFLVAIATAAGCNGPGEGRAARPLGDPGTLPPVVIAAVLADPRDVPDDVGEWIELRSQVDTTIQLRGWTLRSANDRPHRIAESLELPARGRVVLGRSADTTVNGGAPVAYAWGNTLALGNGQDWIALDAPDGGVVDSVAWQRARTGDAMVRGRDAALQPATPAVRQRPSPEARVPRPEPAPPRLAPDDSVVLEVHVLDVGQGDAILIRSGGSTVLVDGGPDAGRMGALLDSLGITGDTVDLVVLTHPHADHYAGLHALFDTRRRIHVRRFAENLDPSPNAGLARLRDSVIARLQRDEMELVDTDDPCGDGRPTCVIPLAGGAALHLLRPRPNTDAINDRSAVVKLEGPDPSRFSMWLAGDAERGANEWFVRGARYHDAPGMDVHVLKGNHHGSCDGMDSAYLARLTPEWVIFSLEARNGYGFVHAQTLQMLRDRGIPWYRTDQNGTVSVRVLRDGRYVIAPSRGAANAAGPSDRRSTQPVCGTA